MKEVPGLFEVALDEAHVALIVELVPDGYRFTGEATVGEGDHHRSSYPEHPPDLAQHLNRPHQIIYRDANPYPDELPAPEWQLWCTVQVLDYVLIVPVVPSQLYLVHPQADDALVLDLRRQVADPAAHQIEDLAVRLEELPVELGDGGYRPVVYVGDEPGRAVEVLVRRLVVAPERFPWQRLMRSEEHTSELQSRQYLVC